MGADTPPFKDTSEGLMDETLSANVSSDNLTSAFPFVRCGCCTSETAIRRTFSNHVWRNVEEARVKHYHIRWSESKLDWEFFNTPEEAEAAATQLARPGETYAVEQFDDDCPRCRDMRDAAHAPTTIEQFRKMAKDAGKA
jgi:hypothetical protein